MRPFHLDAFAKFPYGKWLQRAVILGMEALDFAIFRFFFAQWPSPSMAVK